ncbi:MAG: hypothetical protein JO255_00140 [Alphaproteobacteria bacterium]|nr:hypothetical protein [Alphaproteobacteria bacterium]
MTARDRRVAAPSAPVFARSVEPEALAAFEAVDMLHGRYIPPSRQALRSWRADDGA